MYYSLVITNVEIFLQSTAFIDYRQLKADR